MRKTLACLLCAALLLLAFAVIPQAQESIPTRFVVLGDSIAEGAGAIVKSNMFAERVAREKGYALQNFGKGAIHPIRCCAR